MKTIKFKKLIILNELQNQLFRVSHFYKSIQFLELKNIVRFLLFAVSISAVAQNQANNNSSKKEYYSLIFQDEVFPEDRQGKIYLPNKFENISSRKEKIFIKFEKKFTTNYISQDYNLIIENGINEEGMILFNDQFIDIINISEKHIINIPKSLLVKGYNTVTILTFNYTGVGSCFDNIYLIDENSQKIDLKGEWNYWIYNKYVNNFESKPTQTIDVSLFADFEIEKSISKNLIDLNWKETDVPITFEALYKNADVNGVFWFRRYVNFDKIPNEDIYLSIPEGIDDYDRLYINGYLIGITNCFSCPRNYKIPKEYLSKNNIIAMMLIDKDGPGGINDHISLKTSDEVIDISNNWKYMKIYDLQILIAIKKDDNQASLFNSTPIDVFNLQGDEIEENELNYAIGSYISNNTLLKYLGLLLILVIIVLIYRKKLTKRKEAITSQSNSSSNEENNKTSDKYIMIRSNRVNYKVDFLDIILIESKKDYVKVCLKDNSYMVRNNLKTFLAQLPKNHFVRISKFIAINLNQIDKIDKNLMYLKSGKYYVIGKSYLANVLQKL